MKDFWKEKQPIKVNKKRLALLIFIIIMIIVFITVILTYINNKTTRDWIDINIFRKEKMQNNLPSIDIDEINPSNIYAYHKNIGILNKNKFSIYDSTGGKSKELTIEITTPIFDSNARYLVVGEKKGQKIYLIADKDMQWEKEIEGNILQVEVNQNGFVAVSIVDTTHKTVVAIFNSQGEHLFNIYLASTRAIATSISEDNKYLAIAEVDTSGTMVQSKIKIISIEKGQKDPENSIVKTFNGQANDLILNIKYQHKNRLICMYANKITQIKDDKEEILKEYSNKNSAFASIDFENSSAILEEKSSGIFTADTEVYFINSDNKNIYDYTAESVAKSIYTADNVLAMNLGSEVEFINTNGWLMKRYLAEQEITEIVLSNTIAGIVYRDKIEILNL